MANMSQRVRWIVGIPAFIAAAGAAYKVIAEASDSGFWSNLNGWRVLLLVSSLTLLALGVNWYIEYLAARFAALRKELQDGLIKEGQSRGAVHGTAMQMDELMEKRLTEKIQALEERLPRNPSPQTDYELTVSLRNEVQRFLDELGEQPEADFKLPHDAFNQRLYDLGAFERKLSHGFQLRFATRLENLVHRLGERNIEDTDLTASLRQPPKNLPMLNKIRDALSTLASELKPKQ